MPRTLCVLLWAQPGAQAALTAYEDRVLRLVPEHGGRVVQRAQNSGMQRAQNSGMQGAQNSGVQRAQNSGMQGARNSAVPRAPGGGADGQPAEIQFLDFPSQAALDAYMADPRRTALAADRDRAVARTEIIDVELVPPPV
jgi:uncharacterized protein (DUF1330 family)